MLSEENFLRFKWKYLISYILGGLYTQLASNKNILFVTHTRTKGWILNAKATRLSKNMHYAYSSVFHSENFRHLPDAEGYFFLHQKYFARALRYNYKLFKRKTIVMFTHAEWDNNYTPQHIAYVLNFADKIICLNKVIAEELNRHGVKKEKLEIFHMASDPQMFTPKKRNGSGAIGFCMGYYERKNPELMVEIINKMPDKKFILIGRDWDKYENFKKIKSLANFKYYNDIPYEEYPALYHEMDVFVSTSHLEGGPVPLLEAMLCNVVPVVSNTGFCPDLIKHGENGFLFNSNDPVEKVIELISLAYTMNNSVREAALPHSWENYGKKIFSLFGEIKK